MWSIFHGHNGRMKYWSSQYSYEYGMPVHIIRVHECMFVWVSTSVQLNEENSTTLDFRLITFFCFSSRGQDNGPGLRLCVGWFMLGWYRGHTVEGSSNNRWLCATSVCVQPVCVYVCVCVRVCVCACVWWQPWLVLGTVLSLALNIFFPHNT